MAEFASIWELATEIKSKLDAQVSQENQSSQTENPKKKIVVLYAFNATGKTRISKSLTWQDEIWETWDTMDDMLGTMDDASETMDVPIKTLCYNAYFEDIFKWDNENCILAFDPNSQIMKLVKEQELDNAIIDNFKDIYYSHHTKIEPSFDFIKGEVTFIIASGDEMSTSNIKISKGEESMLIWSVFHAVLETAIEALNIDDVTNRSTPAFNWLQYIIIDDPVSSVDDTKIITMAIKLIDAIKKYKKSDIKFFITTHHALFYNVLVNSFGRLKRKGKCEFESYSLCKKSNVYELENRNDSIFSYHLSLKETIQKAIRENSMEKYHFNLFRNLLEKTSNFLWYTDWSDCIEEWDDKEELKQRLQVYSHSKLSEEESTQLSNEDKELLRKSFETFIRQFNWKI